MRLTCWLPRASLQFTHFQIDDRGARSNWPVRLSKNPAFSVYDSVMTNRTFKTGESREQPSLLPARVEDYVGPDNPVRAIESFVGALDLAKLKFRHADRGAEEVGQPPYDPADLLKLYLYGYINQIRSSRRLEREACRNLELIWLLRNLQPGQRTIANFQRELEGIEGGEPQFCAADERVWPDRRDRRRDRWLVLPWRRQQGQHLHAQKAR